MVKKKYPLQIVARKEIYSMQSSASFALVTSVLSECAIIMSEFANTKYADMRFMYGQAHGNACLALQMYHKLFPRRHCPLSTIFIGIDRQLLETEFFKTATFDVVRSRHVRTPTMEEDVLQRF